MTDSSYGAYRALTLATLAFAANFSVWILFAATVLHLNDTFSLSATELGLILAAPMLTGSLLRIPVGILVDRYDSKALFIAQMLIVAPALFLMPQAQSPSAHLWIGLWLGISGTSFTIGIRYVSDWFKRSKQGTAMGIFGAGNAGAAITLGLVPFLVENSAWGWDSIGPVYGVGLLLMTLLFALLAPRTPAHLRRATATPSPSPNPLLKLRVWRFGLYYYFVFGSFLALIMWLPLYYHQAYQLSYTQAMAFTLFFAITSSMVRALGGWFADRYGGRTVNWSVFWVSLVCLFFLSYPPTSLTIHGVKQDVSFDIRVNLWVFTALIFIMGLAQGFGRASVYKVIHDYYPTQMGTVGGLVSAIGALGGCTLPVIFGIAVDYLGFYSVSFMILYGVLAACMITMFLALKSDRFQQRVLEAQRHNFLDME